MRARIPMLLGVLMSLVACDPSTPVSPASDTEGVDLLSDYAVTSAASLDGAGIGASELPDSIALTAEQKAAIAALHDGFRQATAADVAALRAIEQRARDARASGESREEVRAILAEAVPIRARLEAAFRRLQADVWQVYTPAQQAWIADHRPRGCGRPGAALTDAQVQQIRALQDAFYAAVTPDLDLIRSIVGEARAARADGASRDDVRAILEKAREPQQRVRAAERALEAAILAVLDPAQRLRWLCRRR